MGRNAINVVAFGLAYFLSAAAPIAYTRFGGGVALVWVASALLTARLHSAPTKQWPMLLLIAAIGSLLATGLFGLGWYAAGPLAVVNVSEAALVALLFRRAGWRGSISGSSMAAFLVVACVIGPAATALPGALVATLATDTPFQGNLKNWLIGHSLGMLTFAPVFLHWMRGSVSGWLRIALRRKRGLDFALLILVIASTWATFSQLNYPLLFIPVLALVGFVYRTGYPGAALGTALVAVVGGVFTARGLGPVALIHGSAVEATRLLQIYLASTGLTLLPLAASLTARRDVNAKLKQSEERYRLVTENVTDIVMSLDRAGRFTYVSPSIRNYVALSPETLVGTSALDLIDPEFHAIARERHNQMLRSHGVPVRVEYIGVTGDGRCRWFETCGRATLDEHGIPNGVVGTIRETTSRKQLESELSAAARTDMLTRLLNRRAFFDEAFKLVASGVDGCVALLDIDHFKTVNDSHGHAAGDWVLREVATAALETIRIGDTLARFGGEEFALLLPGTSIDEAEAVCQRVLDAIAALQVNWRHGKVSVTTSAGIAYLNGSVDAALHNADRALYEAKNSGRARVALAA
ncbi:MAG: diguanylate cyclase [Novosphingobium sp.]